jgi:hypothetical protein
MAAGPVSALWLFTQPLKRQLVDYLGYGLALEGMSVVDRTVTPDT